MIYLHVFENEKLLADWYRSQELGPRCKLTKERGRVVIEVAGLRILAIAASTVSELYLIRGLEVVAAQMHRGANGFTLEMIRLVQSRVR